MVSPPPTLYFPAVLSHHLYIATVLQKLDHYDYVKLYLEKHLFMMVINLSSISSKKQSKCLLHLNQEAEAKRAISVCSTDL